MGFHNVGLDLNLGQKCVSDSMNSPACSELSLVVMDFEEYEEIDDFIDRLVGVKHMEIAQSVLRCRTQKISSCTPEGQAVYE